MRYPSSPTESGRNSLNTYLRDKWRKVSTKVPNAVFEELISNSKYLAETQIVVECPFMKRLEVSDRQSIKILREVVGLDTGENEAIFP